MPLTARDGESFALHRADRETVVADDAPRTASHVGLRRIGSLVRERESLQEAVKVVLSAVEWIGYIVAAEFMY
jgi:hypothetical protein